MSENSDPVDSVASLVNNDNTLATIGICTDGDSLNPIIKHPPQPNYAMRS